jgi:hypothetical protein
MSARQRRGKPAVDPAASAKARRSRTKGCNHEREVAESLRCVFPEAKRGLGQPRAHNEVPDVVGTPFWIECKHRKALNVHAAFAQALEARGARPQAAVVVSRKHGSSLDLVTVDLTTFITLLEASGLWPIPTTAPAPAPTATD